MAATAREVLIAAASNQRDVEAALLYGSVARGDAEAQSDLDLLVVCPSGKKRYIYDEITRCLSGEVMRLSLSVYSAREISFLALAKSLFLLHLSRESETILDRTGWLTGLLDRFEPKESYDSDFQESLDLIDPLRKVVVGSPNQTHRLAYVYSLFRVYGVYLLARKQIFEFSKARMVEALAVNYPAQRANVAALSRLRLLSSDFFSSHCDGVALANPPDLVPHLEALGTLVGVPFTSSEATYRDAVGEFEREATRRPSRLGYRLRTWFLLLLYDGLNIYSRANDIAPLTSFSERRLLELSEAKVPIPVREAALLGLEYLRNYPLKYFLMEESKIGSDEACSRLIDLARTVRGDHA